jgi:uncharacterized membrane protein YgdD (TMEM256/DUF423 family)
MVNALVRIGGLMGFLGVGFGAFGAHALAGQISPRGEDQWRTATTYLLVHALAVLWCSRSPRTRTAGIFLAAGGVIFAGSLYLLAYTRIGAFGAVAPIGGILALAGWLAVIVSASGDSG